MEKTEVDGNGSLNDGGRGSVQQVSTKHIELEIKSEVGSILSEKILQPFVPSCFQAGTKIHKS